MFGKIASFEFRYQLRSPVFWVSALILGLMTFGSVASPNIQIGAPGNTNINAPFAIVIVHLVMSIFSLFIVPAFVANVVVRDDDTGYGSIIRSTRIKKFDYLFGRFTGAFLASILVFAAVPIGLLIGVQMPWLDQERLGPVVLSHYVQAFFLYAVPTLFIVSAFLFAIAAVVRSMALTYVGVIVLFILSAISGVWLNDLKNERLASLLDPFGSGPVGIATKYWTASDRNTMMPPLDGLVLENRLLWFAVAFALLAFAYAVYRFAERGVRRSSKREEAVPVGAYTPVNVTRRFDAAALRVQAWKWTRFEMAQVVRSPAFPILILLGIMNATASVWIGISIDGWTLLPVTRQMIEQVAAAFAIAPFMIAAYYAGELVWRERERKSHELFGAAPVPDWVFVTPKILAIAFVLLVTLLVSVGVGIGVQMFKGYRNFELDKYFVWYMVPTFINFLHIAVLAIFLQAIAPHKYVGWGLMGIWLVLSSQLPNLGYDHRLYRFGSVGGVPLSDMNGQGYFWIGRTWHEVYWSAIALILVIIAFAIWPRGTEARYRPRLARLYSRLKGTAGTFGALALAVALTSGAWIFYNTTILNTYRTNDQAEKLQADAERALLKYEKQPQPRIIGTRLNVALYPHDTRAVTEGDYLIENRSGTTLTEVHINLPDELKVEKLEIDGATLGTEYEEFAYRIYKFDTPMQPGEQRHIRFKTVWEQRGFKNSGNNTSLLDNGTFLNNTFVTPLLGVHRSNFLSNPIVRRRQDLPAQLRMPKLEDPNAGANSYLRPDSDWVSSDITVSTVADQTPIAPGYVVSDETKNGRRTVHFKSDTPIQNFYSIQSARYATKRTEWNGIELKVYYHPEHDYNIDLMLDVMKTSMKVFEREFGPYQFRQARMIEFPAIATFAQSFANTIAYSEDIGFLQDTKAIVADPSKIDMVTYVTAHEIAHQWWAHQVLGADVQGSTMLSESFASYSSLLVMEEIYGPEQVRRFLNQERDTYLQGRLTENVEEQPLYRVENQPYIHYRKGAMVLYRLKTEVGAAVVNDALKKMIERYKFAANPYPRSTDFMKLLREATGPQHDALITDLFEKITLYELKASAPKATKRADGKFDVTFEVEAKKLYADGKGKETEAPLAENVAVGVFMTDPTEPDFKRDAVIAYELRPLKTGKQTITFVTDKAPKFVAVDPYSIWVDRDDKDNVAAVDAPAS
jgi:ABC-type transport system involved in multi-copper enzyme maturation permease subunit